MKFIIWTPGFDENSGGLIALHLLCHRLNELGEKAMLWPAGRPALRGKITFKEVARALRWELGRLRRFGRATFSTGPFGNAIATTRDLEGAVIVYPEVAAGNPLKGQFVVRWLLHKPGHHTGVVDYGRTDLFFFYKEAFDDPRLNKDRDNQLTITWLNETYCQWNHGQRAGSAYLMRKGKGKKIVHDLEDSIQIDGLTHQEKARAFNERAYFISYDLYTLYNLYALICGCIPVVIPESNVSKEQWLADEGDRYGIAYGFEDINRAITTREQMLERIKSVRAGEDEMLRRFVRKCRDAFAQVA